jgi:hypothetical protein
MTPWYLEPAALTAIAALNPVRVSHVKHYPLTSDRWHTYESAEADQLRAIYGQRFAECMATTPFDRDAAASLIDNSADEVLAALFGCPDGLEWADATRAARLAMIRANVADALKVAA